MSCNEHAFSLAQNSSSLSNELSVAYGADGPAGKVDVKWWNFSLVQSNGSVSSNDFRGFLTGAKL